MINIFRRRAYQRLFLRDDKLPNADAVTVLADLKRFCRADSSTMRMDSTGRADPIAMAYAEGRREVWLRIMAHLHLEERETINLREEQ
jgi:hypothetical protein